MTSSSNPIERSFELAALRCDDLTPHVYERLFRQHPEAQAMFRSEGSAPVKGSMLALTIEAILDFAGERRGHFRLIESEVFSHDAYGTPRELFVAFFAVIADCLRDIPRTFSPDRIGGVLARRLRNAARIVRGILCGDCGLPARHSRRAMVRGHRCCVAQAASRHRGHRAATETSRGREGVASPFRL